MLTLTSSPRCCLILALIPFTGLEHRLRTTLRRLAAPGESGRQTLAASFSTGKIPLAATRRFWPFANLEFSNNSSDFCFSRTPAESSDASVMNGCRLWRPIASIW